MARGFGFRINYASAIKEDERAIASLTFCLERELFFETINAEAIADPDNGALTWLDNAWDYFTRDGYIDHDLMVFVRVKRLETIHEYVRWMQRIWGSYEDLSIPTPLREGWQDRAQRNRRALDLDDLDMEFSFPENKEDAKLKLKKAKARLSRHKRNQKRYA